MTTNQFASAPAELRERDQWILWRYEDGQKIPRQRNGRKASTTDPRTWTSYDRACRVYTASLNTDEPYSGIGYVFTADDPYTGIDADDCLEAGTVAPWAQSIIDTMQTYTEISPSGTGLKMWVKGSIPKSLKTKQLEMYSTGRYFTVTGQQLPGTPSAIRNVNGELSALYEAYRPTPAPQSAPRPLPRATVDADYARHYALAALEGEHQAMLAAGDNERHNQRIKSAFALGGYSPHITDDEIFAAIGVNFGANEALARKTIADGIASGKAAPRAIPEPKQPTYDTDGHACCPTHGDQLIASLNGNGWRCAVYHCFWWQGEGYTPPASVEDTGDLDTLDPETLRQRLRIAIAERNRWRAQAEHLAAELAQVKSENRFVTQTHGAEGIGTPSKRLTFGELDKEIKRVPVEEREPGQFIRIRPAYMAKCTGQDRGTISRHLGEFAHAGLIEKKVERTFDPETKAWCSETFVRPLVDLSDPSKVLIPSKPRGRQACKHCGSDKLVRETKIYCAECETVQSHTVELVNLPEAELQTAIQNETAEDAATFFEQQSVESLNCNAPHKEKTADLSSELQFAIQTIQPPKTLDGARAMVRSYLMFERWADAQALMHDWSSEDWTDEQRTIPPGLARSGQAVTS